MNRGLIRAYIFIVLLTRECHGRDAFQVLGVSRKSSSKEIKSAYKSLSLKWHPDKNQGKESAAEKFIEISEAYEKVGSEDSRRKYLQELQSEGRGDNAFASRRRGNNRRHAEDIFAAFEEELAREFAGSFHSQRQQQFGRRGGFTYSYSSTPDLSLSAMLWTIASAILVPVATATGPIMMLMIYCCCFMGVNKEEGPERGERRSGGGGREGEGEGEGQGQSQGLPLLTSLEVERGRIVVASLDQYSHDMLYLASMSSLSSDPTLRFAHCDAEVEEGDGEVDGEDKAKETGLNFRGMAVSTRGHVMINLKREDDSSTIEAIISAIERVVEGQVKWESNEELALID